MAEFFSNFMIHKCKELGKKEQTKPKTRRKEIIKLKAEINKIENRKH